MHAVHEGAVCLGYWPRTPGPTGEGLHKGQGSFLSISSPLLIFFNEVELRTPTDQLGTHLEFNPSHFIVEFIWIFFKSLLPESSEVFLLFPVVTKSLNQVHSKNKNKKPHNEQTLQASKIYTKWNPKKPKQWLDLIQTPESLMLSYCLCRPFSCPKTHLKLTSHMA